MWPDHKNADFYIIDSFTETPFNGNPAGVVFTNDPLDEHHMKKIAGELHLETAFLWPEGSDIRICYYTATTRIPLCGHDTIAAGYALRKRGGFTGGEERLVLKSDIGDLPIRCNSDGRIVMRQALPTFVDAGFPNALHSVLGKWSLGHKVIVVSTGSPFAFMQIDSKELLDNLQLDFELLARAIAGLPGEPHGIYLWYDDRFGETLSIYGRCFAPGSGLPEDPVTGSASGALGALFVDAGRVDVDQNGTARVKTTQGVAMGRPGNVYIEITTNVEGKITAVDVEGAGVIIAEGTLGLGTRS